MQIQPFSKSYNFNNSSLYAGFHPLKQNFFQHQSTPVSKKSVLKKNPMAVIWGVLGAVTIIGGAIYYYVKRKKVPPNLKITPNIPDAIFKNNIVASLKSEGINCDTKALSSIVGPDEFSDLIKKFSRDNFDISKQAQGLDNFSNAKEFENFLVSSGENLKDYYSNFVNGKFRVTLHTHSNFSDGRATVSEFLENARRYADHIAKKNPHDNLPPFTIALTDHDSIDGCKEAIRIIAQNPQKYKNLKFISGAELSVKDFIDGTGKSHFDVTALAINPFDISINEMLNKLRQARINTVCKILKEHPLSDGAVVSLDNLIQWQKTNGKGKIDVSRMSGVASVRHAIDAFNIISGKEIDKDCSHFDIPDMEDVIKVLHASNGKIALTHPLKSFWKPFDEKTLDYFREKGIDGFEGYHQYSPSNFFKLKDKNPNNSIQETADSILNSFKNYAEKHNMFLSGGTDSHNKYPFIYHPLGNKIEVFIESIIN